MIENQTCPKVLKRTAHDAHEWWSDRGNGERLVNCRGYGVPGALMAVDQPCHMVREVKPHDPHGWWANHGPDERLARCPGYDIRAASQPVSLPELQRGVEAWVNHNFGESSRVVEALGLAEEVGELCRAVLKQEQGIRGTYAEWDAEIAKEIGDVLIKLASVATACGVDLEFAVKDRWETIRQRDFRADPTGHGIPDAEGHS